MAFTFEFPNSGAAEVQEQDDLYVLVAPQNAVGNCIIDVRARVGVLQTYSRYIVC